MTTTFCARENSSAGAATSIMPDILPDAVRHLQTNPGVLWRLASLGVTEFWPIIFPAGGDPAGSRRETRALLTGLAAAS